MAGVPCRLSDRNADFRPQRNVTCIQSRDVHRLALAFEATARGTHALHAPFLVSGSPGTHEMPGPASRAGVVHATSGPAGPRSFMHTLTRETTSTDRQLRG